MSGVKQTGRTVLLVLVLLSGIAACGSGLGRGPSVASTPVIGKSRAASSSARLDRDAEPPPPPPPPLPRGRAIGLLRPGECRALLRSHGVAFEAVRREEAPAVSGAVLLSGPLGGVRVSHAGGSREHSILDCRLAVALLVWSESLQAAGIAEVVHSSVYRAGARVRRRGKLSGHARGLAIDIGRVIRENGATLNVEEVWNDRRRHVSPCDFREEDTVDQRTLRALVCRAAETELFQVVLTPHYDRAHRNHLHLEVRPEVDWSYLR